MTRTTFRVALWTAGLGLVVAGCGGSSSPAATAPAPTAKQPIEAPLPANAASGEQQKVLADNDVTTAEYQNAYERFRSCVSAGGGTVSEVQRDPVTGVVTFGVDTASGKLGVPGQPGAGVAGRCYEDEFAYVDQAYSSGPIVQAAAADEQMAYFRSDEQPCLELNGVDVPGDLQFGSDEYLRLDAQFTDLGRKGKCPGITVTP